MYVYKDIVTTDIEDIFLGYAMDVNVFLTSESNKAYFDYVNAVQEQLQLDKFESWKDYYQFMVEQSFCCDKQLSHVIRMEKIHLFGENAPTLCWYGCNPTFGTDKRYSGIIPLLFSDETKQKCTPVFHSDGDFLFLEFSKDYAEYLNQELWHYGDKFEYNCLELTDDSQE